MIGSGLKRQIRDSISDYDEVANVDTRAIVWRGLSRTGDATHNELHEVVMGVLEQMKETV